MKFEEIIIVKEFVFFLLGLHLGASYCSLILIQSWQSENNWEKKTPIILYKCESAQLCFLNWQVV